MLIGELKDYGSDLRPFLELSALLGNKPLLPCLERLRVSIRPWQDTGFHILMDRLLSSSVFELRLAFHALPDPSMLYHYISIIAHKAPNLQRLSIRHYPMLDHARQIGYEFRNEPIHDSFPALGRIDRCLEELELDHDLVDFNLFDILGDFPR